MLTTVPTTKGVSNPQRWQVAGQKRSKVICSHVSGWASHVHVDHRLSSLHTSVTEAAEIAVTAVTLSQAT